jgi:fibronectin-binding autotransporter adhesin
VTLGSAVAFEGMQFRSTNYVIEGGGFSLTAAGGTIVRVDPSVTATINAPITGAATLTKNGAGLLVLGGTNSYTGGTAINGGIVRIGADANLGAAAGGLSLDAGTLATTASFASSRSVALGENGGTFSVAIGTQLTLGGAVTGSGVLGKTGAGTLVLSGANGHTGGTHVGAGTLLVSSDANLGAATAPLVLDGGTLRFGASFDPSAARPIALGSLGGTIDTGSNTSTFVQGIGGAGALTKQGTGTLVLAGANSYSGGTTIGAGTLRIGDGGTAGSIAGDVANNGAIVFYRSDQISYGGAISGSGTLTQAGSGTTVLTGINSYSGGTFIGAGTLAIGNGGTSGSIAGAVVNNGTLLFNRSDAVVFGGVISGAGALRQEGGGTLTLTGANSYTGGTAIVRGRVETAGSLASLAVVVETGATLSGGGSIAGLVTVADGAHFAPGPLDSPGILSVGALSFAPGAQLDWRLGQPQLLGATRVLDSPLNDLARVAGDLTLDGTVNVIAVSGAAALPGSYRLIEYGGALTDNGVVLGPLPARFASTVVQTAIPGQVNLIAVRDGLAIQFWDGSDALGNGQVNGGTGTWTFAAGNWTGSSGAINQQWLSGMAIFTTPGGQVTLGEDLDAIALQFVADGYRIQGAGHTLTFRAHASGFGGLVRVDPDASAEIGAVIAGTAGLAKVDSGRLILSGANSYSGGTSVLGGTLQIGNGGTSGSIVGDVEDNARLVFNRSDSVTFAGAISGLGSVGQIGSGVLSLTGRQQLFRWHKRARRHASDRTGCQYRCGDRCVAGGFGQAALDRRVRSGRDPIDLARRGGRDLRHQRLWRHDRPARRRAGRIDQDRRRSARARGQQRLCRSDADRCRRARGYRLDPIGHHGRAERHLERHRTDLRQCAQSRPDRSRQLDRDADRYRKLRRFGGRARNRGNPRGRRFAERPACHRGGVRPAGATIVQVDNLGGEGDLTTGDGILVVDAAAGGTTAPTAFALAGPLLAGPYEYQLQRGGASSSAADDWFLRSTLDPDTPSYRLETSLYAALPALALSYGRSLMGTLHERVGDVGREHASPRDNGVLWSRVLGRDGRREGRNGILSESPGYDYDYYALQLGADLIRNSGETGDDFAGVYGAYGSGNGEVEHFTGERAGEDRFDAYSLGAYWTHLWPTGWYLDGVVQGSWYDLTADSVRLPELTTDGFGFAASIEGGRSLQSGGVTIEPQAQIVFQTASLDRAADVAAQIRFDDMESLAGRIGARVAKTWDQGDETLTLWARANLWYEFLGETTSEFSSATGFSPLHADLGGEWLEFNAGVTVDVTSGVSVHGNVTYETDFGNDLRGLEAQMGVRIAW